MGRTPITIPGRRARSAGLRAALAACALMAAAPCALAGTAPTQTAFYTAATSGQTTAQILTGLYPGSAPGGSPSVPVRVLVTDLAPRVVVRSVVPLRLTDEGRRGPAVTLEAGHRHRLVLRRGKLVLDDLDARRPRRLLAGPVLLSPGPTRTVRLAEPFGHRYRGALRIMASAGNTMQVVNVVDLERYLWGALPGQAPPVWGVEAPRALRAAAIATRTNLLFGAAHPASTGYDLTADDPLYLGRDGEQPATTAAAKATTGRILTVGNEPFAAALTLDGWVSPMTGATVRIAETSPFKPVPGARPGLGPAAVRGAQSLLGVPYLWGGATPGGFDCSGLVQYVYGRLGLTLPRVAQDQARAGMPVMRAQLAPGDAVFFADSTGLVHHEGLYIGNGNFIHAPHTGDVVRISSLTSAYYAARYAGARRYSY